MIPLEAVAALQLRHRSTWRNRGQSYWFQRLAEEFGELGAALADDHPDPVEWELMQIAAICINWLEMRSESAGYSAAIDMLYSSILERQP